MPDFPAAGGQLYGLVVRGFHIAGLHLVSLPDTSAVCMPLDSAG